MPKRASLYLEAANFESEYGTKENYQSILNKAIEMCPKAETFWLMLAKSKWQNGDESSSREILEKYFF